MSGMETNDQHPDTADFKFDAVAIEALSAGIGLGTLVPRKPPISAPPRPQTAETKETKPQPRRKELKPNPIVIPPQAQDQKTTGRLRSILAYFFDLSLLSGSLITTIGVAHFVIVEEIPTPPDLLFYVASRFDPYQIIVGITSILISYFIIFKLLAGLTPGETLFRVRRNK